MFGTFVNTLAIVAGSLAGLMFRRGIPQKYNLTVMQAISLAVVLIGIKSALRTDAILLVIFSLALGAILGELLRIEARLDSLGRWLENRLAGAGQGAAKGFVTASLVFCVGSMAIVGSLESGLTGNHETLFAKSMLDGIAAIIFASSFGVGVIFAAGSVLIYQGGITIFAAFMSRFLTPEVIGQMSGVGGLLILALGFNLLEYKRIRVGNMLPAIFVPLAFFMAKKMLGLA